MALDGRFYPDDASRAQDHVMNKSKAEQGGEEDTRSDHEGLVDEEGESSQESERGPEYSKNNPARARRGGNYFNVTEVKSLVAFDQDQLFDQKKVISPDIKFRP